MNFRILVIVLITVTIVIYSQKVNAEFTYIEDDIHPEIGWVDVKRIGWDIDSSSNELILTVQYQEGLPPCSGCLCQYHFAGQFYLNTDQNIATGIQLDDGENLTGSPQGADFLIQVLKRGGEVGDSYGVANIYRWDDAEENYVFGGEINSPTISPEQDTITLNVDLADLDSPPAIDIVYKDHGQYLDYFSIPIHLTAYNVDSEDRLITVDGDPVPDWMDDLPDVMDLVDDFTPGWMDAATFYSTDSSTTNALYLRLDLSSSPLSIHPEEASRISQEAVMFIDIDEDQNTGYETDGIGAEYSIKPYFKIDHSSRTVGSMFLVWNTATERLEPDDSISEVIETVVDASLEIGVPLSSLGVSEAGSIVPIAIRYFETKTTDRVPNLGSFTVTTGSSKFLILVSILLSSIITIALIFMFYKRGFGKKVH